MFHLLRKKNAVVATLSFKYPTSHSHVRFISNNNAINIHDNKSFTISYLMSKCGLSYDKAASASEKVQLKTSTNPDSVLTLFKKHGISNTHISKIVEKDPKLLVFSADGILKPKLEFFQSSLGFSGPDLAKYLSLYPIALRVSLKKKTMPCITFLKSIIGKQSNDKIISILKRAPRILAVRPQRTLVPNVVILQAQGVPNLNISVLLQTQPRVCLKPTSSFKEVIELVQRVGIDPLSPTFIKAVQVLSMSSTNKSTTRVKVAIFKKWGLSEYDICRMLRVKPRCLTIFSESIMSKMEFFVSKMGYDPLLIAKCPNLLTFSMEKRIVPRCKVVKILISTGLIRKDQNLLSVMCISDINFTEKFIFKFEERVLELLNAYMG